MSATVKNNQPYDCSLNNLVNKLADWYKPGDTAEIRASRTIFKVNTVITLNNVGLAGVITGLALACFSSFAVLGLALAAVCAISNWLITSKGGLLHKASEAMKEENIEPPKDWHPQVATFGNERISWLRCFPAPKTEEKPGAAAAPAPEGREGREQFAYADAGSRPFATFTTAREHVTARD